MSKVVIILTIFGFIGIGSASFGVENYKLKFRIVGGYNATIEEVPWQATIHYYPITHCGGSIINEDTILTAAHCFEVYDPTPKAFTVRVGNTRRSVGGQVFKVKKITVHPDFNISNYHYDIAILKLDRKITYSKSIQPVTLPEFNAPLPVGKLGMVTGYGQLSYKGPFPQTLQKVFLPIMSQESCIKHYKSVVDVIKESFCAGTGDGKKDACYGDSGGPLTVNKVLYGIVSFGVECALPEYPGVFANVAALRKWIDNNI